MTKHIGGAQLKRMILGAATVLEENKETLDALNVFPVPDGDTGTNMSMTMLSAAKEVAAADETDTAAIMKALSLGALKGARGNSGVILSQIFAGFSASALKNEGEFDGAALANALRSGVDCAYKAVMKPKEGTILTVARSMADAAEEIAAKTDNIYEIFEHIVVEGEKTLRQTPEMLPVLKEAGVVDAGGAGLVVIIVGFKSVLDGKEINSDEIFRSDNAKIDFSIAESENEAIEFGYCTEFFVKNLLPGTQERDIDTFRTSLGKIGDCVLVVGDLDLVKTHVHTNEPGLALQYGQILGELSKIKIDNMREQHRELDQADAIPKKELAVIAVVSGEGLKDVFRDCQINDFVSGGQSMNPSTDDIVKAVRQTNAKNVIILPNNKNIILAAQQAKDLCEENLYVIPSKSFPQGIAAAVSFDPDAEARVNEQRMNDAIAMVKTGSITTAVRDTKMNGREIKEGDMLGIFESAIVENGADEKAVFRATLAAMIDEDSELITIYYGDGVSEQAAQELGDIAQELCPDGDIEVMFGGQPVYPYIFAVE